MAELIRGGARAGAQHTGEQYGAGYQYSRSREFTVPLGPWRRYAPDVTRFAPDVVADGSYFIIQQGSLHTLATQVDTTLTNNRVVGSFLFTVAGAVTHLLFYADSADSYYLKVRKTVTSATTHASTIVYSAVDRITAVVWGDIVYFGSAHLGTLYSYNPVTGAFAAVSGSPANVEYMCIIDNNVVCAYYDTTDDVWYLQWAVDSDPTDWSSEGSGAQPLAQTLGDVCGFAPVLDYGFVSCEFGAQLVVPTGTLPAFTFESGQGYLGAAQKHMSVSDGVGVTYLGRDLRLHYWSAGQDSLYQEDQVTSLGPLTSTTAYSFYSAHLDKVIMTIPGAAGTIRYILDPKTRNVVGNYGSAATQWLGSDGIVISGSAANCVFFFSYAASTVQSHALIVFTQKNLSVEFPVLVAGTEVTLISLDFFGRLAAVDGLVIVASITGNTTTSTQLDLDDALYETGRYRYKLPCMITGESFVFDIRPAMLPASHIDQIVATFVLGNENELGRVLL